MVNANKVVVSIDPTAAYADGDFIITGEASSPAGIKGITFRGFNNTGNVSLGTTTVDPSGHFQFDLPIRGTSTDFVYATATDYNGTVSTNLSKMSLDGNWRGQPYVASEDLFTSIGARAQSLYFRADGSIQSDVIYGPSGSVALRRVNNDDGTNTTTVTESGATVQALPFETIQNGGEADNTFVFDPGHGLGIVQQFRGNGADHDTLSFKGADFGNSVAEVLANTHQYKGVGTYIVDPVSGDAVRITNISKAELAVNKADIAFHA